jgi:transposase-like protein
MSKATVRWTHLRKASVVLDVRLGVTTIAAACAEHGLTFAELDEWLRAYDAFGLDGLKVTRLQKLYQGAA